MFSLWNLAVVLLLAILSRTNATSPTSVAPSVAPTARPATYSNISAIYTSGFSTDATDPTTQLSIYVKLATGASEAIVYCGAFATTIANINVVPFTTTTAITKQGFSQSTTAGVATLLITGLIPSSTYNVYCMTVNLQDPTVRMPYVVAIKKSTLSTTQCCKVATFTTGISSLFFQSSTVSNTQALTISLNAAPTYNLTLTLTLYDAQTKSVAPASVGTLTPSTMTFYPSYTPGTVMPVVLVAGNVGTYRVNFTMSGASVDEFALATSGSKTIKVLSLDTEPSAPVMTTATFSADGTYVTLLFDSPTNQGNKANTFSCNDLLLFDGVTSATCTWSDTKTILIYPTYTPGAAVLSPGSNIALYSNEVQAYCTDTTTLCTNWVNYAPSTTVKVKAPTLPTAPTVVMSGPATVGMCSPVTIDMSNSVGAAGRPWASTKVTVSDTQSNANITYIQALLNSTAYTISPPTAIPNKWLIAGHTYTFTGVFTNFLGAVGSTSKAVTVSSDSLTPVVSIAGLTTRTITTWTQLLVTAVAYTQTCNGGQSANNLKYVWTIYQTGVTDTLVTSLTSTSQNPAAFKLNAYALTVGNTYRVQVAVTSTLLSNPTPVTASVYVVVNPSALVAAITGGTSRSVQVGDSYTIDASTSYDQDKQGLTGINAGLTYSWTCWQTTPSYSATCPVTLTQGSTTAQRVVTTTGGTVGAVARVTVTVTSSGRTASTYMDIKLTNKPATVITIGSSLTSLTSVNVNQQITLTGSLAIVSGCVATWKVDDASLNLPAIALTPTNTTFTLLTPVVNTMALLIPGGSLPQRATLGFSLSCGSVSSTFSFTTNGSPLPGVFTIKPRSGIQLVDSFTFSGSQWIDPDLPLSYQFGFISPSSGALLVFQGKSESSYAITKLPGGSASSKHLIFGTLQVYDVYGAATTSQLNVTVTAGTNTTQQNAGLASLIAQNSGSVDDTNSVIATVGTVLNAVNCTGAPDCAALHRASCGSVSHTCGICLTGYLGVAGNQNSKCMTLAQYSNEGNRRRLTVGDTCTSNAGCNAGNWETCVSGKCVQASKSCPNSCSDLGTCTFTSSSTGATVTSCGISDATCVAACVCNSGYGGTACEYTRAELDTRIAFRSQLIQSLENVTMIDDVNEVSIVNWATALSSLSLNSEELSVEDAAVVHRIANLTIAYALQMGTTDYASLIGLLESLDSATTVVAVDARRRRLEGRSLSSSAAAHTNILQTAGSFGDVISKGMALDQTSTTYLYSNFRMSTQINTANAGNNVGIMGPQSDLEYYSGAVAPYINIEPTNDASGSLSSTMVIADTTSFAAVASEMKSNPMQFRVNTAGDLKTVTFTMINNVNHPEYSSTFQQENFTHYCLPKVYNVSHTCSGSGTKVRIFCTGWAGTRTTWCPRPSPACSFLDGETMSIGTAEGCTVIDKPLQPGYTTCQCKLTSGHRRQLTTFANVLSETGVTNMVTTSTYIASTFADTFKASTDFTSPADARKVLIVILLFAILWAVGLLSLVGLCFDRKKKIAQSFEKRRSHKVGSSTHTTADVKRYLLAYVDKLIPDVYHATKSKMERAADETRKHHRYLQLFTARDDQISVNKRILTLTKMLTIQTMLMFLLAVLYDLQGPDDDGTCPDKSTKSTCLHRKSILDSSQTYCQWKIDEQVGFDTCTYKQPVFSAKIMMYIILLTSIFTAIFNTPIDKLFDTLEAPTGDSIGESRLVKATKAVAAGARRASVAAAGAAAAAASATKNTMSRMSVFKSLGLASDEEKVLANRRIPEDVHFAHTLAYMSLPEISAQAQVTHLRQSVVNNEIRNVASKRMTQIRGSELNKSMKKPVDESVRGAERTDGKDVDGKEKLKVTSDDMVDQLLEEIMQQRLILPSNSDETNEFDRQWGIEKNSVTSADGKTISTSLFINGYSLRGMSKDVATSEAKSRDLKEKMENFSDNQAGLDILHFFMVDLLGRHTLAAKIFENKFEEDFERTEVVSKYTKWFVVACIVGLNGFFMYYSLLKGYTKGIAWQNQYLQGCITQLFIEIFLFESMECVWINYWVPDLVSGEVMRAGVILRESAEKISLADKHADSDVVHSKYFLDAPTYLFVSTKLAKKFPNLLESIIVNGYRNHLPGEIARTWRNEHSANENAEIVRNSYQGRGTFGAIMFSCIIAISSGLAVAMQALGSLPYFYQRVIIRFVQPVLLSGLTVLWYFAVKNPIYVAAIVGSMLLVGFVLYVRYKNRENNQAPAKIAPIVSPAVRHGLVSSHKDNGESKLADKSESKNAESKMNEVQMSGRNLHEAPLNKAQYAGSSLTSEEGVRIVPKHHRKVAKNNDDSSDSAKDSN